ncbi:MAG TPA: MFS transporter, partial [Anaerolineae bacterium]|nr:MFS transporter [Anaerolineae bacterium]
MDTASSDSPAPRAFTGQFLFLILFARTVLNTAVRAVYPFLPFIAADLNVSFQSAASIIQARDLIGITAPLFGPLSDRYGRRAIMLGGMGIATLASLALLFVSPLAAIVMAMAFISLGVILFVPAQQAFLGDRVPYAQRGRVIAAAELAWSFAAIIGLPLVGIIIHNAGWRWAFAAIGILGIIAFVLLGVILPRDAREQHKHTARLHGAVLEAFRQPIALAAISTTFLLAMANENLGVIYGEWMKNTFALDPVALGFVGAAIGGAEFAAEMFAVLFLDRIGKWRTVAGAG